MYTNIPAEPALTVISNYIHAADRTRLNHYNLPALIEALQIVFQNNVIQFGDTYWQQTSGTGMGTSPAPPWATIFYALHENTSCKNIAKISSSTNTLLTMSWNLATPPMPTSKLTPM
ncbi:hypothetical protein ACHAW6_009601 [Cyclotella cf. meneghiniana]